MGISVSDIADPSLLRECLGRWPVGLETIRFGIGDVLDRAEWELPAFLAEGLPRPFLHGPYLDLFPASMDSLVRQTAMKRFECAYQAAKRLGARGLTFHSGYLPPPYGVGDWLRQSVSFWREFLADKDGGIPIFVENVFDRAPTPLAALTDAVNLPFFSLCLDVGHANVVSPLPLFDWISTLGGRIGHVHLHNNDGTHDAHGSLKSGTIPMERLLKELSAAAPQADLVLEIPDGEALAASLEWLEAQGFLPTGSRSWIIRFL